MFDSLLQYYGLDWCALAFGLMGCHLITLGRREGFLLTIVSCACGLATAMMSGQIGYIFYNAAVIFIMTRGLVGGSRKRAVVALGAE